MSIFEKGSKTYSIFTLTCPRCQEEKMFETGSWSFKKSFDMRERCTTCGLNYYPELGFYQGAMYVSYIWTGWVCLFTVLGLHWGLGWSVDASMVALIVILAINFPFIFRISRLMWLNFNVRYDARAAQKHAETVAASA